MNIPFRPFGPSGLRVSTLALGTGTFGNTDWGCTEEGARQIYIRYRESGGNFIDTANTYADGESESIVGRLTTGDRDQVVIGTKFAAADPGTFGENPNGFGNHAKGLRLSLDRSLQRLGTEYVDVLWVHAWDPKTSIPEMMRALDLQVKAGKVLALGASNLPAWVVARANALADSQGSTPFSAIQVEYSLVQRGAERDLFPMAHHLGLTTMAWAPLAWGILTGKYLEGTEEPTRLESSHPKLDQRADDIAREVRAIAEERGLHPSQVALAWIMARPDSPIVLLGARNLGQLEQNLGILEWELDEDAMGRLDRASALELGVPRDFLRSSDGIEFFYGEVMSEVEEVGAL
jgi:aryl-alcohol dehydrogenase-like predicted oxidoreductase